MVQIRRFTCAKALEDGLKVVGFDVARQRRTCAATNIQRFRAAYGVGPGACSAVYRDLQTTYQAASTCLWQEAEMAFFQMR